MNYLLFVISLLLILVGIKGLVRSFRVLGWIRTDARITSISEGCQDIAVSEYSRIKYFYPEICYEYTLDRNTYVSCTVGYDMNKIRVPEVNAWGDEISYKARFWSQWHVGSIIPVYVNPRHHGEAVVIRQLDRMHLFSRLAILVSGVLLFLFWLTSVTVW